jgi:hypothetical protein
MAESPTEPTDPVFPTRTGKPLSRDAVERRLARHQRAAAPTCPSLHTKHITAHVLRHTAAMRLLEAGVDTTVIALWLGHERVDTTAIYLHAHLEIKEKALARTAGIAMAYKLIDAAQARWRAVNAPHLVALVRAGAVFHKGKLLERPIDITPAKPDESSETEVA